MTMSRLVNVFFDLDGVLAIYSKEDYIPPTTWDMPGSHYFANRPVDERALRMLEAAMADERITAWVISTITTPVNVRFEQMRDKVAWAMRVCSVPRDRVLVSPKAKSSVAKNVLERNLTRQDLLVDDWNQNLSDWRNHGGRAAKYLNGINEAASWDADVLTGPKDLEALIEEIMEEIMRDGDDT